MYLNCFLFSINECKMLVFCLEMMFPWFYINLSCCCHLKHQNNKIIIMQSTLTHVLLIILIVIQFVVTQRGLSRPERFPQHRQKDDSCDFDCCERDRKLWDHKSMQEPKFLVPPLSSYSCISVSYSGKGLCV